MNLDGSIAIFQYWNRLRDGRPAPRQVEIKPADIKTVLADTFILERARSGATFRLAGTRVCAIYGREMRGSSFDGLWTDGDQRLISPFVHGVFGAGKVVTLSFEGLTRNGRTEQFEMMMLPLDAGPKSTRCLGLVSAETKPFWLGADPVVAARVESVRAVDPASEPEPRPSKRTEIGAPALAPTMLPADEDIGKPRSRRIRHLVVLEGGRKE
ncbi:MAG: PAS domain-containing protein [Pseudorhodoplanes sp.]